VTIMNYTENNNYSTRQFSHKYTTGLRRATAQIIQSGLL